METIIYLIVSAVLFSIGVYGLATTRNVIRMLLSAEVTLNGALLSLIAIASATGSAQAAAIGLIIVALAGTEVGIFISLCILLFRCTMSLDAYAVRFEEAS